MVLDLCELNWDHCNIIHHYMTDSRDRGISQSAFENLGPYIPIRTTPYGPPHTDRHFITLRSQCFH